MSDRLHRFNEDTGEVRVGDGEEDAVVPSPTDCPVVTTAFPRSMVADGLERVKRKGCVGKAKDFRDIYEV